MHEWALAEGVIAAVNRTADENKLEEITEVVIRVGELQQVEHDILLFALDQLKTPPMENTEFILEKASGKLRCRACGEGWTFNPNEVSKEVSEAIHFVPEMAHVYVKCPVCGSPDFEVVEGRGVWLTSVKGVTKDD